MGKGRKGRKGKGRGGRGYREEKCVCVCVEGRGGGGSSREKGAGVRGGREGRRMVKSRLGERRVNVRQTAIQSHLKSSELSVT